MKEGLFPESVAQRGKSVTWVESEVQEWILGKIGKPDNTELLIAD